MVPQQWYTGSVERLKNFPNLVQRQGTYYVRIKVPRDLVATVRRRIAALEALERRINRATGLSNPSDKEAASDLFSILRKHRVGFVPEEVRDWAVQRGWLPAHADQLNKVAEQALKRKAIPADTGKRWADNIFAQWSKT